MKYFTFIVVSLAFVTLSAGNKPHFPDYSNYGYNREIKAFQSFMKPFGKNYEKALFKAASQGHTFFVKEILTILLNVDACDQEGKTALTYASEFGEAETCAFLIKKGASVNAQTNWLSTPLMYAAQNGHLEVCRVLLKAGAKVNAATKDGKTALMYAAEAGHTDICRLLLKYGVCIDARTHWGSTALMWAAEKGHLAVSKLLVKHGADVYASTYKGKTVFDYAYGHNDICTFLGNKKGLKQTLMRSLMIVVHIVLNIKRKKLRKLILEPFAARQF